MAQNKDLVADAQTLLEENLSEKKSVESARRLSKPGTWHKQSFVLSTIICTSSICIFLLCILFNFDFFAGISNI